MQRFHAGLILVAIAGVLGIGVAFQSRPDPLPVGAPIPPLTFRSTGGVDTLARAARGRTVVIVYAKTCEHCRAELSSLDAEMARTRSSRVILLTFGAGMAADSIRILWPNLAVATNVEWGVADLSVLKSALGVRVVPTVLVFNDSGRLNAKYGGEVSPRVVFPNT